MSESSLLSYLESVVYGGREDVTARSIRIALRGLSWIYTGVIWLYLLPFRLGLRKTRRLPVPVISIGNITVGGTGKTPVVQYVCKTLLARGERPAVLSYGYGGELGGKFGIVSDGKSLLLGPSVSGDEPAMLAAEMPGVPVLVCKDRWMTGQAAVNDLKAGVAVLDDGFQVWKLARDLDIVLVSEGSPVDNGHTLPAGKLREPVTALRRAGCVLILGDVSHEDRASAEERIRRIAPEARLFAGRFEPSRLRILGGDTLPCMDDLRGKRVFAVSAIGNPQKFLDTVRVLGAEIAGSEMYLDHHSYHSEDIRHINRSAEDALADFIVTTEKDAVKLDASQFSLPVMVIGIELYLDDAPAFWEFVQEKVNAARTECADGV